MECGFRNIPTKWMDLPTDGSDRSITPVQSWENEYDLDQMTSEELEQQISEMRNRISVLKETPPTTAEEEVVSDDEIDDITPLEVAKIKPIQFTATKETTIRMAPSLDSHVQRTLAPGVKIFGDKMCQAPPGVWLRIVSRGKPKGWSLVCLSNTTSILLKISNPNNEIPEHIQAFITKYELNTVVTSALLELPESDRHSLINNKTKQYESWENTNALIMHQIRVASKDEADQLSPDCNDTIALELPVIKLKSIETMNENINNALSTDDREAAIELCTSNIPINLKKILRKEIEKRGGNQFSISHPLFPLRIQLLSLWVLYSRIQEKITYSEICPVLANWGIDGRNKAVGDSLKRKCAKCGGIYPESGLMIHESSCKRGLTKYNQRANRKDRLRDFISSNISNLPDNINPSYSVFDGMWDTIFEDDDTKIKRSWSITRPFIEFHHNDVRRHYKLADIVWSSNNKGLSLRLVLLNPPATWSSVFSISLAPSTEEDMLCGIQSDNSEKVRSFKLYRSAPRREREQQSDNNLSPQVLRQNQPKKKHLIQTHTIRKTSHNASGVFCTGVYVTGTQPGTSAEDHPLLGKGARMISVNGQKVNNNSNVELMMGSSPKVFVIEFNEAVAVRRKLRKNKMIASRKRIRNGIDPAVSDDSESTISEADSPVVDGVVNSDDDDEEQLPEFTFSIPISLIPLNSYRIKASSETIFILSNIITEVIVSYGAWSVFALGKVVQSLRGSCRRIAAIDSSDVRRMTYPKNILDVQGIWNDDSTPNNITHTVSVSGQMVVETLEEKIDSNYVTIDSAINKTTTVVVNGQQYSEIFSKQCENEWKSTSVNTIKTISITDELVIVTTIDNKTLGIDHKGDILIENIDLSNPNWKKLTSTDQINLTPGTTVVINTNNVLRPALIKQNNPTDNTACVDIGSRKDLIVSKYDVYSTESSTCMLEDILKGSSILSETMFRPTQSKSYCHRCGKVRLENRPELCNICEIITVIIDLSSKELKEHCRHFKLRCNGRAEFIKGHLARKMIETYFNEISSAVVAAAVLIASSDVRSLTSSERLASSHLRKMYQPAAWVLSSFYGSYPSLCNYENLTFLHEDHVSHNYFVEVISETFSRAVESAQRTLLEEPKSQADSSSGKTRNLSITGEWCSGLKNFVIADLSGQESLPEDAPRRVPSRYHFSDISEKYYDQNQRSGFLRIANQPKGLPEGVPIGSLYLTIDRVIVGDVIKPSKLWFVQQSNTLLQLTRVSSSGRVLSTDIAQRVSSRINNVTLSDVRKSLSPPTIASQKQPQPVDTSSIHESIKVEKFLGSQLEAFSEVHTVSTTDVHGEVIKDEFSTPLGTPKLEPTRGQSVKLEKQQTKEEVIVKREPPAATPELKRPKREEIDAKPIIPSNFDNKSPNDKQQATSTSKVMPTSGELLDKEPQQPAAKPGKKVSKIPPSAEGSQKPNIVKPDPKQLSDDVVSNELLDKTCDVRNTKSSSKSSTKIAKQKIKTTATASSPKPGAKRVQQKQSASVKTKPTKRSESREASTTSPTVDMISVKPPTKKSTQQPTDKPTLSEVGLNSFPKESASVTKNVPESESYLKPKCTQSDLPEEKKQSDDTIIKTIPDHVAQQLQTTPGNNAKSTPQQTGGEIDAEAAGSQLVVSNPLILLSDSSEGKKHLSKTSASTELMKVATEQKKPKISLTSTTEEVVCSYPTTASSGVLISDLNTTMIKRFQPDCEDSKHDNHEKVFRITPSSSPEMERMSPSIPDNDHDDHLRRESNSKSPSGEPDDRMTAPAPRKIKKVGSTPPFFKAISRSDPKRHTDIKSSKRENPELPFPVNTHTKRSKAE